MAARRRPAYGIRILRDTVEHVAAEVTRLIAGALMGTPRDSLQAVPFIAEMDAEVTAALALRTVLNSVSTPRAYQTVAVEIGATIEDEAIMRRYKETNPAEFARTMKTVEEASSTGHYRRTVARRFARMKGNVTLAWTQEDKYHIGALLLDPMYPMGLFTTETYMRGPGQPVTEFQPTDTVLKPSGSGRT